MSQDPSTTAPPTSPPSQPASPLRTSGMAVTSLVLGIFGLCIPLLAVAPLVLGIVSMNRIDNPANRLSGRGAALGGTILGGIGIVSGTVVPLLIGILLPALNMARQTATRMESNTRLRGIHQNMVIHAQSNGGWYPGLTASGTVIPDGAAPLYSGAGDTPAGRYAMMLDAGYFPSEFIISPAETAEKRPWTGRTRGAVSTQHYSYAMLAIQRAGTGRRGEWRETFNHQAPMMSDRGIGESAQQATSVYGAPGEGWTGGVVWNDNHVAFEGGPTLNTQYGLPPAAQPPMTITVAGDHLFDDTSGRAVDGGEVRGHNALMVYERATDPLASE